MSKKRKEKKTALDPLLPPAPTCKDMSEMVKFASYMTAGNKQLLQYIKVMEGRSQIEIVADALQAYAAKHHPELLRKFS